ncbi:MAG: M48 family metallopeptidase [Nanoarchaeota archaeon]
MERKIKIPLNLQFRIYFSLVITLALFISIYVALYYIGIYFTDMIPIGYILVGVGVIPLIFALSTKSNDRGFALKQEKFPKFIKVIKEVSQEIGVRMPDEIQILPTEEIYVTGLFRRKIGVGIAGLRSISSEEFKSILAHEFGHFYGKDTIVGTLLAKIQISLEKSSKFGKAWWDVIPLAELAIVGLFIAGFAKGYSFIFRVIISIYSRQVEYRADYIASHFISKETFGRGLVNYLAYTVYFESVGYNSVISLLSQGKRFVNIYKSINDAYVEEDHSKIKQTVVDNEKTRLFSSHPSLSKRLSAIGLSKLDLKSKEKKDALLLLDHYEELEKQMTATLTDYMRVNLLYQDAVAREGKCRYCGEQFEQLNELLEHESKHNVN